MKMGQNQKQIIELSDLVKEIFFKDIYNRKMENQNIKFKIHVKTEMKLSISIY